MDEVMVSTEMLEIYYASNKNSGEALRRYIENYPDREVPSRRKFSRLHEKFRRTGSLTKFWAKFRKQNPRIGNENIELDVLLAMEENPHTSTRQIASNLDLSHSMVHRILKKHKKRDYKTNLVQHLQENDAPRRTDFCNTFLQRINDNNLFLNDILWSDESTFSDNGIFNRNVHYYWSDQNPRNIRVTNFQIRFSVNVWCGMKGNKIIGPHFFNEHLNSHIYNDFLRNELENYLEELPVNEYVSVMFQQDGAPSHNAHINVQYLNERFGANWIGTNGPIRWPARSPDLTPLDFFLWAYLKDQVYITVPENLEDLKRRIRVAVNNI